jgi:hypothetical protein
MPASSQQSPARPALSVTVVMAADGDALAKLYPRLPGYKPVANTNSLYHRRAHFLGALLEAGLVHEVNCAAAAEQSPELLRQANSISEARLAQLEASVAEAAAAAAAATAALSAMQQELARLAQRLAASEAQRAEAADRAEQERLAAEAVMFPVDDALEAQRGDAAALLAGHAAASAPSAAAPRPPAPRVCAAPGCSATVGLRRCGGCGQVRYCSTACRDAHWRAHRRECRRLQAEAAAASSEASGEAAPTQP